MSLSSSPKDHFVFLGFPAWGHCKGLASLAIKIIKARPKKILVTFFTFKTLYSRILDEIERHVPESDCWVHEYIRLVGLVGETGTDGFRTVDKEFLVAFRQLCDLNPLLCAHTNTIFDAHVIPRAVIIDALGYESIIGMREIDSKVKICVWVSTSAAGALRMSGPKELGGLDDQLDAVKAEAITSGLPITDVADKYLRKAEGNIIHIPGLPPMYDHEFVPQEVPFITGASYLRLTAHRSMLSSDCIIVNSFDAYEPDSLRAFRYWLKEASSIDVFTMAFPEPHPSAAEKSGDVQLFLDKMAQCHGRGSLAYMSLGTLFWPTHPEMVWYFIDTLMQMNIPFVFAHASHVAEIPEEMSIKVQEYGLGLITSWAPQDLILSHSATGLFVTHGGQNSTLEALLHGVPMIFWPFDCDQPTNAIHSTSDLDIAYELYQVRTGSCGQKPILHLKQKGDQRVIGGSVEAIGREARDILQKAMGEEGEKKRQNMRKFGDILKVGWESRCGIFTQELERFLGYALS